jgi:hypothetical protein
MDRPLHMIQNGNSRQGVIGPMPACGVVRSLQGYLKANSSGYGAFFIYFQPVSDLSQIVIGGESARRIPGNVQLMGRDVARPLRCERLAFYPVVLQWRLHELAC